MAGKLLQKLQLILDYYTPESLVAFTEAKKLWKGVGAVTRLEQMKELIALKAASRGLVHSRKLCQRVGGQGSCFENRW